MEIFLFNLHKDPFHTYEIYPFDEYRMINKALIES